MKNYLYLFAALFVACNSYAQDVHVSGYTNSNGSYIAPHYRTAPNNTVNDNFSTVGNVNPYTGEAGYISRENNYIYTNSIPDYDFATYGRSNSIIAPVIESPLGDGSIPLSKEISKSTPQKVVDISKPFYGSGNSMYSKSTPSYRTYPQQDKSKNSPNYLGICCTLGLSFAALILFLYKYK